MTPVIQEMYVSITYPSTAFVSSFHFSIAVPIVFVHLSAITLTN